MGKRQKEATVQALKRTLKIARRGEVFYDIRIIVINIIIFSFAVIEIIFIASWFIDKFFEGLPDWLLLFKYLGIPVLLLLVYINPIADKIVEIKER